MKSTGTYVPVPTLLPKTYANGCVGTDHAGERLCRGEEDRVWDVVDAGHNDPQAGPGENVRIVALPWLVCLKYKHQYRFGT